MAMQFEARAERLGGQLILRLPQAISDQLPARGMGMGELEIRGQRAVLPLEPDGRFGHFILLKGFDLPTEEALQASLSLAETWPEPEMPADILDGLHQAGLDAFWACLTVKARWEWLRWIRSTNNAATRHKRIGVAASKMLAGERRPCCFNTASCTLPELSKSGVLRDA